MFSQTLQLICQSRTKDVERESRDREEEEEEDEVPSAVCPLSQKCEVNLQAARKPEYTSYACFDFTVPE